MAAQRPFFFTTSWDDGTVHDLRLAALLAKYGLPATFYVAKHHPYGSLEESAIRILGRSFELGAHTMNHLILDSTPNELAEREIRSSKSWIEQLSGCECRVFCFPQGRFSARHVHMVSQAGFYGARTVELMSCRTASLVAGVAIMPTTIQVFPHEPRVYLKNIFRRGRIANFWTYLHAERKGWAAMANSLLARVSLHGGVFHLWGHAWEIEQFNLWCELEQLFQTLAQYKTQAIFVSNADLCAGVVS